MKKNILIGVTGGIAAYKIAELVRLLVKSKFNVKVMMTESATKFVTPLTFQTLSGSHAYKDMFALYGENVEHISLAEWADLCVLAPLSANTLSKVATGMCDNLLTTVVCALGSKVKVLCVPAMNVNMWKNPIIVENTKKLSKLKKYIVMQPDKGELACGVYGEGRMPEPAEIAKKIKTILK